MNESTCHPVRYQEQFGRQAHSYAQSWCAALARDYNWSGNGPPMWAAKNPYSWSAGTGTETGFTTYTVAPYAKRMLATDITSAMLRETQSLADQRGIANLGYALAAAEGLPFANGSLDLVTCHIAAHYSQNLGRAVAELGQVLAPHVVLLLADTSCPDDWAEADCINDIEERWGSRHVRNLPPSEVGVLEANDFRITDKALAQVPLEFDDWVRNSCTPAPVVKGPRRDFVNAPFGSVEVFDIHQDKSGSIRFQW